VIAMAFEMEALIYIDFANTVDFKEKQKVPHSYSRAEENARFVTEFDCMTTTASWASRVNSICLRPRARDEEAICSI
jgi:hypothetical protein